jgi:HK97 family phage prohead protease
MLHMTAPVAVVQAEEGEDKPRREIYGTAVPYGVDATVMDGTRVRFQRGALPVDGAMPKLIESHDMAQIRGLVTAREDTDTGMQFTAKIAATRAGDDVLELIKMGAIDSVSVGVNPTKWSYDGDTMVIQAADWTELSLVAVPAFAGARIAEVAATTPPVEENTKMADATTPTEDTPTIIPTAPLYATAKRAFKMPSAAEYIACMTRGGHDFAQMNVNIRAAAGDEILTDIPGLLPTPVVAPIYDDINALRPIVSALGPRAMPGAGKVFIRPKISIHTEVGNQGTELTGLSARTMEVDDVQVTKKTFGGVVTLSEQTIDFSDPSMLTAVLTDLAGQYALATEFEAASTMAAAISSANREVTDLTDAAEVIADIYGVAALQAEVGNYLPTHIIVAPKTWAKLGSLVDQSGRPVFPQTAPLNGIGTLPGGAGSYNGNPLGLQLVVSNQIKDQAIQVTGDMDDYLFVCNARFMEVYEQQKGTISIEVPSTLGRTVAFRGYFASIVMDAKLLWALGPAI